MGFQRVSFFYYKSKFEEYSAKEIMDIGDKELIQLLSERIVTVKLNQHYLKYCNKKLEMLLYTEHICGLHICFLSHTEGYTDVFSKIIKELFYELSVTLVHIFLARLNVFY